MPWTLLAADLGPDSTIALGAAVAGGVSLFGIGGWVAILRHRQDELRRDLKRTNRHVKELWDEKIARDAVKAYRQGRQPDTARPRPHDSSAEL